MFTGPKFRGSFRDAGPIYECHNVGDVLVRESRFRRQPAHGHGFQDDALLRHLTLHLLASDRLLGPCPRVPGFARIQAR